MNKEIYKSDRYFTAFDFLISHGQLLLRSSKNKESNHNIDIIFFGTRYIQLFTSLYGISIFIVNENLTIYNSVRSFLDSDQSHLFEIKSKNEKFYIGASFFKVYENDLEFNETSLGIPENRGREKEITGSR